MKCGVLRKARKRADVFERLQRKSIFRVTKKRYASPFLNVLGNLSVTMFALVPLL